VDRFTIESDTYWLLVDPTRFSRLDQRTWMIWLAPRWRCRWPARR